MASALAAVADYSVDVVIPVYNGAPFIEKALRSVLAQDLAPARIVVIDDGSTDATAQIVQGLASPIPIRYLYQENRGLSSARNSGIRECRSRFVAFLDADDLWLPHKLSSQIKLFQAGTFPDLGAVYCRYLLVDAGGEPADARQVVAPDPENRGYIFERLLEANRITGSGSGILVKRESLAAAGGFDEQLNACEDWDMWLRLARHCQFDYVDDALVQIRRHGGNMQKDGERMFLASLIFYNKWSGAARESGHARAWGNAIVYRISEELPALRSIRLARTRLIPQARKDLFNGAGSLYLFLLQRLPTVLIIVARRILLRKGKP